ncbi:Hsp20 family protein [Methyloceanibacter sp.]|uniref:Hsp20 family protein n=1 Tax=Methyloceanibacter sp. TaxID=1965321 RepID=UPI0020878D22|nr:Hsp20 family protein [Methyloceanibacter sp.]GFO82153.1 MAG: heat-shock protein Hsp20 [Methyloceanibacter sp.]HML91426.1 Hsp20 family protein [Methyloceanibacter sp.]
MTPLDGSLWISFGSARKGSSCKPVEGGYPPYNVELLPAGSNRPELLRITLAVAGFACSELDVRITGGVLQIRGEKPDDENKDYLHRGIAARRFKRTFALVNGVEVRKAELHNGLLAIELERPSREKRVRKVGITSAS